MAETDYLQFYNLEDYLFNTVSHRFHTQGFLSAYDFFCIIIWKSNRAKGKMARRLLAHSPTGGLDEVVCELTTGIINQATAKGRLWFLWYEWGFRLPMASAILTVLYPDEFTVFDYRVCDCLGNFHNIGNTSDFEKLWGSYVLFRQAVIDSTPAELTLRNKDRYLWSKSFADQLSRDLASGFLRGDDE